MVETGAISEEDLENVLREQTVGSKQVLEALYTIKAKLDNCLQLEIKKKEKGMAAKTAKVFMEQGLYPKYKPSIQDTSRGNDLNLL